LDFRLKFFILLIFVFLFTAQKKDVTSFFHKAKIGKDYEIYYGKEKLKTDVGAIVFGGIIYIPVRFILEKTGADIFWNNKKKEAVVVLNKNVYRINKNSKLTVRTRSLKKFKATSFILEGRMMVPLEIATKKLGGKIKTKEDKLISYLPKKEEGLSANIPTPGTDVKTLVHTKKTPLKKGIWGNFPKSSFRERIIFLFKEELNRSSANKAIGNIVIFLWFFATFLFFKDIYTERKNKIRKK
jgi:hypothetical protein